MARRVERFALQSVARDILPDSRTAKCLRIRAHDRDVQVWKSKKHKTASYGGLRQRLCVQRLGGVASQQAMAQQRWWNVAGVKYSRQYPAFACGGEVHLLTLTAPHTRFDVPWKRLIKP